MKYKIIRQKIFVAVGTIFFIISMNFFVLNLMPGDPLVNIIGGEDYYKIKESSPEILEEIRKEYELDKPLFTRYIKYVKKTIKGDFGYSYSKNRPTIDIVLFRLKWTLYLAIPATILSALIGGYLGIISGWNKGEKFDKIATPIAVFINTIPSNALAIIFLSYFSFHKGWFPISGMFSSSFNSIPVILNIFYHMFLPLSVIVILRSSSNFLSIKSYISNVKTEEYILTAYSKGLNSKEVMKRHAIRNAILPYITLIFMQFGGIFSGTLVIELVFSWMGMGTLISEAIKTYDFPILQLSFLITTICIVTFNLIADILITFLDPRLRSGQDA